MTQLLGCGSDEGSSPAAGGGAGGTTATGGAANSAGISALAGNSGAIATGGAGTAGSGASTSSNAGSAGSAVVIPPDNFNRAVPIPSFDCRTAASSKRCVSIRGTINGATVDTHCLSEAVDNVSFDSPLAWVADCLEGDSAAMGRRYQVTVPVQKPGPFSYDLLTGAAYAGASMTVQVDLVGGSSVGDHYGGGAISGAASDADFGLELIVGSFHGTWNAPGSASCNPHISMGQCGGPSDINGTFKMQHLVRAQ
ncbi:MAG: hypothetical protein ABI488_19785 [Polyangiaceae bacterium]